MKKPNRLVIATMSGTALTAATVLLYYANQSNGPSLATPDADPVTASSELQARSGAGSNTDRSGAQHSRRVVDSNEVAISLTSDEEGVRLSQPRVRLIDTTNGDRFEISGDGPFRLEAEAPRTFRLESLSKGWTIEREQIEITEDTGDVEIPVHPRHSLFVQMVDARLGSPIENGQVQVHWESAEGVRNGSPILLVEADAGGHFLLAPPIKDGRLRIEASANLFRPYQSDWAKASEDGWFDFEAALVSTQESTGTISVRVVDPAGSALEDAWVAVFEEVSTAPTTSMLVGDDELLPVRRGTFDTDLVARPVTAKMAGGVAEFRVEAPGTYRVASWDRANGQTLSEPISLEPRDRKDIVHTLAGGIRVEGRLTLRSGATELEDIASLGRIVLTRDEHRFESSLDPDDLTFAFSGLAPGEYQLAVTGFSTNFEEQEVEIPIHSERITVPDASPAQLLVELGSTGQSSRIEGRVLADIDAQRWKFIVGLTRAIPAEQAQSISEISMRPLQGTTIRPDGTFTFANVPPGEYRILAMGRRDDLRAVAFFDAPLRVDESGKVLDFELRTSVPAREFRTSDSEIKFLGGFRARTTDRLAEFATRDLPEVMFGGGESTWLHGRIPGTTLLTLSGDRVVEIPEGADVVLLQ